MIVCTLDGKKAYPKSSDKIKVTFENQYVKDSGSYTYDITFPMDIPANREVFGNVQRMDVKKKVADFEECRMYADNRLIMSGKGTVTAITQESVKLQLVGGKSRIKYNSKFEEHFIDEIEYPDVTIEVGVDEKNMLAYYGKEHPSLSADNVKFIFVDLRDSNIVGQRNVAVFSPMTDEDNDIVANLTDRIAITSGEQTAINSKLITMPTAFMANAAPSPYLQYITKKVLEHEGYTIKKNELDKEPWNRLVIVSACKTGKLKDALPHWSVYTFLEELRKFFNASFVFDEIEKTVSIEMTNELITNNTVSYECEDDFSTEYEDDGLDNLTTSNIEYDFDSATNRDWRETISAEVLKENEPVEYESLTALWQAFTTMDKRTKWTTIFKVGGNLYIWANMPKKVGDDENTQEELTWCGVFNPIIRDAESDTYQQLKICPVAMHQRYNNNGNSSKQDLSNPFRPMAHKVVAVPSLANEKESDYESMEVDDDGSYYNTIQEIIESGTDDSATDEDDDSARMLVAFVGNCVFNTKLQVAFPYYNGTEDTKQLEEWYRIPVLYTDYRTFSAISSIETASLSLTAFKYRGMLGTDETVERFGSTTINSHNQITIKFVTDEIPDPSKIYVFNSKRYICEKVEMNVTDDGIEKEKTGYFYEIM